MASNWPVPWFLWCDGTFSKTRGSIKNIFLCRGKFFDVVELNQYQKAAGQKFFIKRANKVAPCKLYLEWTLNSIISYNWISYYIPFTWITSEVETFFFPFIMLHYILNILFCNFKILILKCLERCLDFG